MAGAPTSGRLNSSVAVHKVDYYVWRKLARWMRAKHYSRTRVFKGSPTALYRRVGLVTPRGTVKYAPGVVAVVIVVAAFAGYVPARRASRVEPMVALRTD